MTDATLPPGLDLLWGRRPAGRRGPKAELDVGRIVAAAVALADEGGIEAVSMAKVAGAVGFTTMSLYRHVASKDELLALMWNESAATLAEVDLGRGPWREQLRRWAFVQREALAEHPWIVQMSLSRPPIGPSAMAWLERGLACLDRSRIPVELHLDVLGLVSLYVLIHARVTVDEERGREQAPPGVEVDFLALVRELADRERYPRLRAIADAAADSPDHVPDPMAEFTLHLEVLLDGIERLVRPSARRRRSDAGAG